MTPRCETCRSVLGDTGGNWTDCPPCDRAIKYWSQISGDDSDQNYAYHEAAHHVVLFRSVPKRKCSSDLISDVIRNFSVGRSQLHELRVLALQYEVHRGLGWRPSISRLVDLSWNGLAEARVDGAAWNERGMEIVMTRAAADRRVRLLVRDVSPRNSALYARALREMRGEA